MVAIVSELGTIQDRPFLFVPMKIMQGTNGNHNAADNRKARIRVDLMCWDHARQIVVVEEVILGHRA